MADEEDGDAGGLCVVLELGGALANLRDAARGGVDVFGGDGLYGVDDEEVGLHGFDVLEDALGDGLGDHVQFGIQGSEFGIQTVGAHLDLLLALFAADVEELAVVDGESCLQQQSALADARFATQEKETAGNDATAEDAVELRAMGGDAAGLAVGHLLDALGGGESVGARMRRCASGGGLDHLFGEGAELAALGAAAEPRGGLVAALLAEEI